MSRLLIIGAGGVSQVATLKCLEIGVFSEIMLASRTKSKCDAIAKLAKDKISTAQVNADNVPELVALMKDFQPDIVLNVALPYQDLTIMDACLECGVHYVDTANYEPLDTAKFEYSWQWDYQERFKEAGLFALLGSGFDPGVTNIFTAWALKHHFDEITELDIIDVNGGDHGQAFATNFNPEINIREVTAECRHWEDGKFIETPAMSMKREYTCPEGVGTFNIYRMYHEELESLTKHIPTIKKAQFWMSFSDNYLKHLEVLQNVGMTRIDEIEYEGQKIVPLQFLKAVLPNPGDLGKSSKGKTCIGNIIKGTKDGKEKSLYIYNICDHEACFEELGSQAISYTTGVPAAIGTALLANNTWQGQGVFNMEEMDPDPFMDMLNTYGLKWTCIDK
ncbi:saccharopine dehydrogenase family protein [Lentisphaera marina]|uniref:saccharopine dehydrogenase family protein n=1 Tax=Lentisphaera marina TaxID=1111041 RepID=UPI002365FFDC|nr:saccharopine dehydrogenase family protein [Lentisphaera marina]MDD7984935.1 saccharopine dehydrogenase family protein [Lentisphaera marina]